MPAPSSLRSPLRAAMTAGSLAVAAARAPYRVVRSTPAGVALQGAERLADEVLLRSFNYAFFAAPAGLRRLQARVSYDALSLGIGTRLPGALDEPALDELTAGSGFLNYGYADDRQDQFVAGLPAELKARADSVRLYHLVVSGAEPRSKDVLEVGCGRGGGCRYIKDHLAPASVTGVDLSPRAIAFCNYAYATDGLRYVCGDAQALPFEDESFDIVVNVESSHCYGSMDQFLAEVRRVLRPNGMLAWADARPREALAATKQSFLQSGLEMVREENITAYVLRALEASSGQKLEMLRADVPFPLRPLVKSALAVPGTLVYEALRRGDHVYLHRLLRKPR